MPSDVVLDNMRWFRCLAGRWSPSNVVAWYYGDAILGLRYPLLRLRKLSVFSLNSATLS